MLSKITVHPWVENFHENGIINKTKPPGSTKTIKTLVIERVGIALKNNSQRSARKHTINLQTVQRILHEDLHIHPYKILMTQELLAADYT